MSSDLKRVAAPQAAQHGLCVPAAPPGIFHVPLRICRVADSATPLGDPLLKAKTHIGASGAAGLAIDTSLVAATYGAILRSLAPRLVSANSEMSAPSAGRKTSAGTAAGLAGSRSSISGMTHRVLHGPPRRLVLRRKPGFRLSWLPGLDPFSETIML